MITRLDQIQGREGIYEVRRLAAPILEYDGKLIGTIRIAGEACVARLGLGPMEVICSDINEAQQVIVKNAQRNRLGL